MELETKRDVKEKAEDIAKRYNIDLEKLKKEQETLAKQVSLKDSIDFSQVTKIGGISQIFFQNKIIAASVVLTSDMEIIEQKYFSDKVKFPYISGFRAYRELPAMLSCFHQLDEKPEVVFIAGHGILHPRLGIASHFSIVADVPSIGVADSLLVGEIKGDDIIYNGKAVGKVLQLKKGSRPIYVSPGSLISVKSAAELARKLIKQPHKIPEPLRLARKYAKEVMKEVFRS